MEKADLRQAVFDIVTTQIQNNCPAQTKTAYDRLLGSGHTHEEAMKLIGCVLTNEMAEILSSDRPFDETSYADSLRALPDAKD